MPKNDTKEKVKRAARRVMMRGGGKTISGELYKEFMAWRKKRKKTQPTKPKSYRTVRTKALEGAHTGVKSDVQKRGR
jgi:hypothetical protein